MSRLFTFGCSFTRFYWPTWAEIIAYELKMPHQNWGVPGIGNVGMHSRLLECDLRNNFNEDDIILVVWSNWAREDFFNVKKSQNPITKWSASGGTMHSYDKNFIDTYCSVSNDLIKNSNAMISANKMFDIGFNGHIITPMINLHNDKALAFNDKEKEVAMFYEACIPNDGEFNRTTHPCSYAIKNEIHPDIISQLAYVNEYICPKLGISLSNKTIDVFTRMHDELSDFVQNVSTQITKFNYNTEKSESVWGLITKFMSMYGWYNILKSEGF